MLSSLDAIFLKRIISSWPKLFHQQNKANVYATTSVMESRCKYFEFLESSKSRNVCARTFYGHAMEQFRLFHNLVPRVLSLLRENEGTRLNIPPNDAML